MFRMTLRFTLRPLSNWAPRRMSSMRLFSQEPRKARLMGVPTRSVTGWAVKRFGPGT